MMYAAAGLLVERVTGSTWEDYISRRILNPLSMNSTYPYRLYADKRMSQLYKLNKETYENESIDPPRQTSAIAPAGSIQSTARDMIPWLRFHLSQGQSDSGALLSQNAYAQMLKPVVPYRLMPFETREHIPIGYGLGWCVDIYRGEKMIQHSGNVHGASSVLAVLPERQIGVAILTNREDTFAAYALAFSIIDQILGETGKDWADYYQSSVDGLNRLDQSDARDHTDTDAREMPFTHPIDDYVGTFNHAGYG
jgi:CubicO group peptidase (beta-lactamase class C family)